MKENKKYDKFIPYVHMTWSTHMKHKGYKFTEWLIAKELYKNDKNFKNYYKFKANILT